MQYNIHLPYYNETFLYGYGFGIPQSNLESEFIDKIFIVKKLQ